MWKYLVNILKDGEEMKIQVICENCGKFAELKSTQRGNQVQMWKLQEHGFSVDTPSIELNGDLEEITDIDEIEAELKEVRFNCSYCGDYIVLEP